MARSCCFKIDARSSRFAATCFARSRKHFASQSSSPSWPPISSLAIVWIWRALQAIASADGLERWSLRDGAATLGRFRARSWAWGPCGGVRVGSFSLYNRQPPTSSSMHRYARPCESTPISVSSMNWRGYQSRDWPVYFSSRCLTTPPWSVSSASTRRIFARRRAFSPFSFSRMSASIFSLYSLFFVRCSAPGRHNPMGTASSTVPSSYRTPSVSSPTDSTVPSHHSALPFHWASTVSPTLNSSVLSAGSMPTGLQACNSS
mmetsp:Transcript_19795/g.56207  ORF Transcript_19795/g.56207 Transcript_19795/m.56207 type:complete len:261 (-) Transcript_19795:634-1416(-)